MSTAQRTSLPRVQIPKTPSHIRGLDDVLRGGLPQGRISLISGGPGTGKTILALEALYRAALAGEAGVFITFEEDADAVRRNALALGWDVAALEERGTLLIMEAEIPPDLVLSGEFDISGLLAILGGQAKAMQAKRVVIDAMDGLLRLFHNPRRQQNQLHTLHRWLRQQELTTILTAKNMAESADTTHLLDYLVDCVIRLDARVNGQVMTRRLRVLKYRGSDFLTNEYPYVIAADGVELMPISTVQLQQQPLGTPVPTGNARLDELLGGGFRRTSCVLIAGSSGVGKTTLACSFAADACNRHERVLYMSFEESSEMLVNAMLSPGVDLRPALEDGWLQILTAMPESLGVEEHLLRIFRTMDTFQPDHLIVDAISACQRMGSAQAAFDFLVRLLNECKARGITCIYTNQLNATAAISSDGIEQVSGIGISSLVDVILLLEQRWQDEYARRIVIIKARGSKHSHQIHPFRISEKGISIEGVAADQAARSSGSSSQQGAS